MKLHPSFTELGNKSLCVTIGENWGGDGRMKSMWLELLVLILFSLTKKKAEWECGMYRGIGVRCTRKVKKVFNVKNETGRNRLGYVL